MAQGLQPERGERGDCTEDREEEEKSQTLLHEVCPSYFVSILDAIDSFAVVANTQTNALL